MNAVAVPRAAQGVPKNTLTWKNKLYIIIKIFYICSILETPSITKLGTPSNYIKKKNFAIEPSPQQSQQITKVANPWILKKKKNKKTKKQKNKTKQKTKKQKQKNISEKTNPNTEQITKSKITYESEITKKS